MFVITMVVGRCVASLVVRLLHQNVAIRLGTIHKFFVVLIVMCAVAKVILRINTAAKVSQIPNGT